MKRATLMKRGTLMKRETAYEERKFIEVKTRMRM